MILICSLFLVVTFSACEKNPFVERVYSIKIENNSPHWIAFIDSRLYPDTLLPITKPFYGASRPNDFAYIDSKADWPDVFTKLPKDTLSIFILNSDTVITYNWDIIRSQYKILKRYDLSLQDLKNRNFVVTYP